MWKKLNTDQIKERVFSALKQNVNFFDDNVLGVPASHLDSKVFYSDAPFLHDAPYIATLLHNPNHIGCHTLGSSESFFKGTQQLEKEVIEICATDILKAEPNQTDGYIASGGTEANLQAIWIYRNYFNQTANARLSEICILCSADSHYSMSKAANLLNIGIAKIAVDSETRQLNPETLKTTVNQLQQEGTKYFIVVANMMTTMFGSVDDVETFTAVLTDLNAPFKLHIDGAYGGFFYPFADEKSNLNFANKHVSSVTLDAHKMVQAPYGTGIFLIRKDYMAYANTKDASYVEGEDYTIIGSRSGANAVSVWMILMTYGFYGWKEKITILLSRTNWLCLELDKLNIAYYRHPKSNIVTIKAQFLNPGLAHEFGLVPDNHQQPNWYKIVVMEHVTIEKLQVLMERLAVLQEG